MIKYVQVGLSGLPVYLHCLKHWHNSQQCRDSATHLQLSRTDSHHGDTQLSTGTPDISWLRGVLSKCESSKWKKKIPISYLITDVGSVHYQLWTCLNRYVKYKKKNCTTSQFKKKLITLMYIYSCTTRYLYRISTLQNQSCVFPTESPNIRYMMRVDQ